MIAITFIIIGLILLGAFFLWVYVVSDALEAKEYRQARSNVVSLGIDPNTKLHRIIKVKWEANDYTIGTHPFWYVFEVEGKQYIFSSVELEEAGIL